MNTNSLSYQLGTSVAQYLMQYGQKELNYEEFKAGIDFVMNMSAKAKEEGEKFLAENAKREGVKTTASGLQYEVLEATIGQKPKATDTVKVHYEGTLIDGTVFDSSYKRGESISFPLNGVSLTVCEPDIQGNKGYVSVCIIPYTHENTNFKYIEVGTIVNMEFDILGKYLSRYAAILKDMKQ